MPDILIIDDDESLTELLGAYLEQQGYSVQIEPNGVAGMRSLFNQHPKLVILDVTMPERDGWETLERIREASDLPVIMLTARSDEHDVLKGFLQGADDYVTKPFSFAELAARINAVLARSGWQPDSDESVIEHGDLRIDPRTRQVSRGEVIIALTPTEFKLLAALANRVGEVVSPEELVKEVWGPQYAREVGHVRRYIWHLRQKIEPDPESPLYVHNERGFGYRFQAP
ncbi:MAG: response regulator transcription factor [Anaerolineae bacterium]|nr:response regulator transcription factor [Anaerolineae bacterium]